MKYFGEIINTYYDLETNNIFYISEVDFEKYLGYKYNDLHYVVKLNSSEITNIETINLYEIYFTAYKTNNLFIYLESKFVSVENYEPTIISKGKYLSGLKNDKFIRCKNEKFIS